MNSWSNLAKIVYKRTYSRSMKNNELENFEDTVERVIQGNIKGHNVPQEEIENLRYLLLNRKAGPAGRGFWYSGTEAHGKLGGVALNNCWALSGDLWQNLVAAMDLLMLGGGVGISVEHRYVSKLPKVKKGVEITHQATKDAHHIVSDSREGWCNIVYHTLKAHFVTGKSFTYSTVCVRGMGEPIHGFGGKASGPMPLVSCIEKICKLLKEREGKHIRPEDMADLLCCIGEMVVAGNVRRSAIIIIGDCWDKDYLRMKRWDLGNIPTQRAMANFSVACDDVEDMHPLFWKTYEMGEPFGIVNRKAMQKYGRMGEEKKDTAELVNPCLTGDTLVAVADGRNSISIKQLAEESQGKIQFQVYSARRPYKGSSDWKVEVQQAVAFKSGTKPVVRVNLSNGDSFRCTPDHRLALKGGGYAKAEGTVGMTLARFFSYTEETKKYRYINSLTDGYKKQHILNWEFNNGKVPKGSVIDHLENNYDDRLSNLQLMSKDDHNTKTSKGMVGENNGVHKVSDDPRYLNNLCRASFLQNNNKFSGISNEELIENAKFLISKNIPVNRRTLKELDHRTPTKFSKNRFDGKVANLRNIALGLTEYVAPVSPEFQPKEELDTSWLTSDVTVLSVESTGEVEDVFDLTVENNHNFYIITSGDEHYRNCRGVLVHNCAEATLESYEPCNLQEIALNNIRDEEEFILAARLMHRYGKRVTCESYHIEESERVVKRNRRVGTGITGCLQSPLFNPETLDRVYAAIQEENVNYSKELNIPVSIRTTVVKPSGTMSKMMDAACEGIHAAYSRYMIQRVRFASNDKLIPLLKAAGHYMEPQVRFDGTLDHGTLVVDFYLKTPEGAPVADEAWDTWKQLEVLKMAQKHWADQAVSVTVYYKREDLPKLKEWLKENLHELKTISFLCHSDHGFKQAPKEAITKEQYEKLSSKIKPIEFESIATGGELVGMECEGGACPIR